VSEISDYIEQEVKAQKKCVKLRMMKHKRTFFTSRGADFYLDMQTTECIGMDGHELKISGAPFPD